MGLVIVVLGCLWGLTGAWASTEALVSEQRLEDGVQKTRNHFMDICATQWRIGSMESKLDTALSQAFEDQTKDMMWGTTGAQLLMNRDHVIEKIQESFMYRFNTDYEQYLGQIEGRFDDVFARDLSDFYRNSMAAFLSLNSDPMAQAFVRQSATVRLANNGKSLVARVVEKIKGKTGFKKSGSAILGSVILYFVKKKVTEQLTSMVADNLVTGAAKAALPVLGWVMAGYGVWDIGFTLYHGPEQVKAMMGDSLKKYFVQEAPSQSWEAMADFVKNGYVEAADNLRVDADMGESLPQNPVVRELCAGLSETDQKSLIARLAVVARVTKVSLEDSSFLKEYGAVIRDVSKKNFSTLLKTLQEEPQNFRQWLDLLGTEKYFDLYGLLPKTIWVSYTCNADSAKTLEWIAEQLPSMARPKATELSPGDVTWIMNELPARYLPDLFAPGHTAGQIHTEIKRLNDIKTKDSRKPWMGFWEYKLAYYGSWFSIALGTLGAIVFSFLLFKLYRWIRPFSQSKKKDDVNRPFTTPSAPAESRLQDSGRDRPKPLDEHKGASDR